MKRLEYAEEMVKQYLPEYTFKIRSMNRCHGTCNYTRKKITLSEKILLIGDDKFFKSVLFHEISHGLAFPERVHNSYAFKFYNNYFGSFKQRCIKFNTDMIYNNIL